ncbi:MAG: hypothetical protein FD125_495 [bacterium]|nr:MAG: hypothetical protein FD125_495 [bacterium]
MRTSSTTLRAVLLVRKGAGEETLTKSRCDLKAIRAVTGP